MPSTHPITERGDRPLQVNTRFGQQTVDPASIIHFPAGLPGFEDLHDFKLFHEEGRPNLFYLQSLDDPDIQFPVINPDTYQVAYECFLSDEEAAQLELDDPADVSVLVTLAQTGQGDRGIHANFMGPILLNTRRRLALQKTLNTISGRVVIRAE
jgi:flagellar assembly factor FliW